MANNPEQTTDENRDKKIVAIAFPVFLVVFFVVILLLRFLCFCAEKAREERNTGGGDRVRQQRQSSEAGFLADRAPSSPVTGAALAEVLSVRAAEPQLVCTYRKADGWQEGSCGVCLAEMSDGDVLRVLPACMHYFHAACVGEWLRRHATCPLCRALLLVTHASAA